MNQEIERNAVEAKADADEKKKPVVMQCNENNRRKQIDESNARAIRNFGNQIGWQED